MAAQNANDKGSTEKTLECPCCGKQRAVTTATPLLRMQETFSHGCLPERWAERYAEGSFFHWSGMQWACNQCLSTGRAMAGKPWLQTFCDWPPYLAYFDRTRVCTDCHAAFVFSAKEQQYWYEVCKFWVQSSPRQCLACRQKRRESKRAAQALERKLKELPESHRQEPQDLLAIASLYLQLGSYRKAAEYAGRARNRARARGELAALADQVEALRRRIQEADLQRQGE
ncbi:MAG TPA: zinc-ribbon domain containing protein [Ktedonobacteraceae bacterium]|nr:zinc-ribbon domain containing protein [Ktedonobacteraceae bacterium]